MRMFDSRLDSGTILLFMVGETRESLEKWKSRLRRD